MTKTNNSKLKIFAIGVASLMLPLSLTFLPQASATSLNALDNDYAYSPVSITNGNFNSISSVYYEGDPNGWKRFYGTTGGKTMIIDTVTQFDNYCSEPYYLKVNPGKIGSDNKILMINSSSTSPNKVNYQPQEIKEGYYSNEIQLFANSYYEFAVNVKTATFNDSTEFASVYISGLVDENGEEIVLASENITSRDAWSTEYFYIKTGDESQKITIDLWLGTDDTASNGVAFFDDVRGFQYSENKFYDTLKLRDKQNKPYKLAQINNSEVIDTSSLNFDFENPQSQENVNKLYAWEKSSTGSADAQIINMNKSNFEKITGLSYPGTDYTYQNSLSLALWSKTEGSVSVKSLPFEIKALGLYKVTLKVKFTDLEKGSFYVAVNETEKIKSDFEYLKNYTPCSATSTAETENGKNQFNNNYTEISFYIQAHSRYDSQATLSLMLGTETEKAIGGVVVDNITLQLVDYEDFSTDGNYVNFSTSTDNEQSITNGYFTNGEADASLSFPVKAKNFELSSSSSSTEKVAGIINIYEDYFNEYKSAGYTWALNLANPGSPNDFGSTQDVNNIFMMYNEAPDWQAVTSSSFSLTAEELYSYYNLTFSYKTLGTSKINIKLASEDGTILLYDKNISSNGSWKTYSTIINAGEVTNTVKLTIELGSQDSLIQGYAFIDNIELLDSDETQFNSALNKINLSGFMLSNDPTNEINYTLSQAAAYTGKVESGTGFGGIIKGEGNDSYGYAGHDSIDDGTLTQNVLVIETEGQSTYSLTYKFPISLKESGYYSLTFRLLTSLPDSYSYTDDDGNQQEAVYGASVGFDSHILISELKSNNGWKQYTIYYSSDTAQEVNFVFKLISDREETSGYAYITDIALKEIDEETYNLAENDKAYNQSIFKAQVDTSTEEDTTDEEETTTDTSEADNNNDYIWLLIPSLIFGVTIILAVILYFLQKFKWNKKEKKDKGEYNREVSLYQDVLANEAKAIRDEEIKNVNQKIDQINKQIEDMESDNKQTIAKARETGKVTKEIERKFKSFAQKRTHLQKTIEELNEHLAYINTAEYLMTIEKRIINNRKKSLTNTAKQNKSLTKKAKTNNKEKSAEKNEPKK